MTLGKKKIPLSSQGFLKPFVAGLMGIGFCVGFYWMAFVSLGMMSDKYGDIGRSSTFKFPDYFDFVFSIGAAIFCTLMGIVMTLKLGEAFYPEPKKDNNTY